MMGPRACKTIALAIAVLASGCQFPPPPQASTEAELRSLGFSKLCQPNLPVFGRFYYPGDIWPGYPCRPPEWRAEDTSLR